MKIVHLVACLQGGGIQNFLLSLAPEQVKLGHEVTLICLEKYDYDYCYNLAAILQNNGVKVICLNKYRGNKISLITTMIKCISLVIKIKPDIINTHGTMCHTYGFLSSLFSKATQILTIHNAPEHWPIYLNYLCGKKPLIFCSNSAYELKEQKNINIVSIDNGISRNIVHSLDVVDLRKELELDSTCKIVVLVGSLRPQKNYLFLKEIVDELNDPKIHFCICGGNYGDGYISMDLFNEYPQIHCLGLRSDISSIENGSNCFLSCAKFEGLPIAVLESYFNGIPCVLSPIPQHKKISNVEKVWIPEKFDSTSFVSCIRKALECNETHEAIYESRKEQLKLYSINRTAKEYIKFYEKNLL